MPRRLVTNATVWRSLSKAVVLHGEVLASVVHDVGVVLGALLLLAWAVLGRGLLPNLQLAMSDRVFLLAAVVAFVAFEALGECIARLTARQHPVPREATRPERAVERTAGAVAMAVAGACVGAGLYLRMSGFLAPPPAAALASLGAGSTSMLLALVSGWSGTGSSAQLDTSAESICPKIGTLADKRGVQALRRALWVVAALICLALVAAAWLRPPQAMRTILGSFAVFLGPGLLGAVRLAERESCDLIEVLANAFYLSVATLPVLLTSAGDAGVRFSLAPVALVVAILTVMLAITESWVNARAHSYPRSRGGKHPHDEE